MIGRAVRHAPFERGVLHHEIRLHLAFSAAMLFGAPDWWFVYDNGVLSGASWWLKCALPAFCTMLSYSWFRHGSLRVRGTPQANVAASTVRQYQPAAPHQTMKLFFGSLSCLCQ